MNDLILVRTTQLKLKLRGRCAACACDDGKQELPFVAGLIHHRYAQGDAAGAKALIEEVVTRLQALIAAGYSTEARAAKPLGALGSQLLAARGEAADLATAKWLLQTSLDLEPTPPVQYFLARALATEGGAANVAAALKLCSEVVEAQPANPAALELLEHLGRHPETRRGEL